MRGISCPGNQLNHSFSVISCVWVRWCAPPPEKTSLTVNPFGDFTHSSFRTTLSSNNRFSIPLLTALVPDGIKPGTIFLVEFDPESQWLAVATSIAASYLRAGGRVGYMLSQIALKLRCK